MTFTYWKYNIWFYKLTFEKHLPSASRAASQRLGNLRKSWRVFDRSLLESCFQCFVLPVLEYCSAAWCSAADKHFMIRYHTVHGDSVLTGRVLECIIAHRRSLVVSCMLSTIRCKRFDVTRCTLFIVFYICCMCQCGLHSVLWSLIGIGKPVAWYAFPTNRSVCSSIIQQEPFSKRRLQSELKGARSFDVNFLYPHSTPMADSEVSD